MSALIIDPHIEFFWGKYNSHRIYNRSNHSVYRSNNRKKSMICPRVSIGSGEKSLAWASRVASYKRNSFGKHAAVNQALFNDRNEITCDGQGAFERFASALHTTTIWLIDWPFDDF